MTGGDKALVTVILAPSRSMPSSHALTMPGLIAVRYAQCSNNIVFNGIWRSGSGRIVIVHGLTVDPKAQQAVIQL